MNIPPHIIASGFLFALAACASHSNAERQEYTSAELGAAYYHPGGKLTIKRRSTNEYLARFSVDTPNFRPSQIDGMVAMGLSVVLQACPAWRLAKEQGLEAALVLDLPPAPGSLDLEYVIWLGPRNMTMPKDLPATYVRQELYVFSGAEWDSVRNAWCDTPSKLNRQW